MSIHQLSAVSPDAYLGVGVTVHPFAVIEAGVEIGDYCTVRSGAVIKTGVKIGCHNEFGEHAVIGGSPQHVAQPEQTGSVTIGDHNVFREHVTIHRGLKSDGSTTIGDHNYLMGAAHLGHDVIMGNNCICANGTLIGGHVTVQDQAFISGAVAIHQFCRIGRLAMVGGHARVVQDVPPFMLIDGQSGCVVGLNIVGLKRSIHHDNDAIAELKSAYRTVYRRGLTWKGVLAALEQEFKSGPVELLRQFLASGTRGFCQERRSPPATTLRLRMPEKQSDKGVQARAG